METIKGVNSVQKQFCDEYSNLLATCVVFVVGFFFRCETLFP